MMKTVTSSFMKNSFFLASFFVVGFLNNLNSKANSKMLFDDEAVHVIDDGYSQEIPSNKTKVSKLKEFFFGTKDSRAKAKVETALRNYISYNRDNNLFFMLYPQYKTPFNQAGRFKRQDMLNKVIRPFNMKMHEYVDYLMNDRGNHEISTKNYANKIDEYEHMVQAKAYEIVREWRPNAVAKTIEEKVDEELSRFMKDFAATVFFNKHLQKINDSSAVARYNEGIENAEKAIDEQKYKSAGWLSNTARRVHEGAEKYRRTFDARQK